jgi:photosystem II stability/assembly factor-like uncharacterized protein
VRGLLRSASLIVVAAAWTGCNRAAPDGSAAPVVAPSATAQVSGTRSLLIAVSAVSDQVAWVSGSRGTWRRTIDGGATWTGGTVPGADSLQFRDVHALDANTAWVLSIGNGPSSRIYRTDDAGAKWTLQFRNEDPRRFYDCFGFWDARRAIVIGDAVGEEMDVLTTTDGGAHWTRIPASSLPRAEPNEGSFAASGTCVATGPAGRAWIVMSTPTRARLLRTGDYGRTWALETLPITTHAGSGPQSVAFRDARNGMVLGGGDASTANDTLIAITADGGATWTPRRSPVFRSGTWGGAWVTGARTPTIVAAGPSGAAYSRDLGASWVPIDSGNYWSIGFSPSRTGWAVGTQGRITRLQGW